MKIKKNLLMLSVIMLTAMFFISPLKAQVIIGENKVPVPNALLELSTSVKKGGLRLPQLTTLERDALSLSGKTESKGLLIYNTTTKNLEYWNGSKWVPLRAK